MKIKADNENRDAYFRNKNSIEEVENLLKINENKILSINLLHVKYHNMNNIEKFISYLETGRADTFKECLDIYYRDQAIESAKGKINDLDSKISDLQYHNQQIMYQNKELNNQANELKNKNNYF